MMVESLQNSATDSNKGLAHFVETFMAAEEGTSFDVIYRRAFPEEFDEETKLTDAHKEGV